MRISLLTSIVCFGWTVLAVDTRTPPSKVLNCLKKPIRTQHSKLCKQVIDPMKAGAGEYSVIDCTEELEDGYAAGICEQVNVVEQQLLKKKQAKRP